MASMNKVFLMGNCTRDPEVRYAPSGTSICEVGLAVNSGTKEKPEVYFAEIVIFGKMAEAMPRFVGKGSQILVEGRLKLDQWEDRATGQKRQKTTIIADRVQFIGDRRDNSGNQQQQQQRQPQGRYSAEDRPQQPPMPPQGAFDPNAGEDDIPF